MSTEAEIPAPTHDPVEPVQPADAETKGDVASAGTSAGTADSGGLGRGRSSAIVRWGYPVLCSLIVALYARTVAPGPTFSDGPEIVTGIWTLGVIHPTGYPLFTLVAHAFVKILPLNVQPCVKVSLFNALCAGAAALFAAHVTRAVALLVRPGEGDEKKGRLGADLAGFGAALLLGTSPLVWDQVRIPEVYPFHLMLTSWALWSIVRFEVTRKPGFLVMAGLAIGLGLAHHVTMVYMLPAGIIYTLVREPSLIYGLFAWPVVKVARLFKKGLWPKAKIQRAWVFPAVLLVGALPAAFYLYLIWANRNTTGLTWGGVNDWDSLYFHATGRQYNRFMAVKALSHYLTRLSRIPDIFDRQFLSVGTVLILPGLVAAFRRQWRVALLLLLVFLFFVFHGIYYSVGDWHSYLLPAMMAASVFVGVGLDWVFSFAGRIAAPKRLLWLTGATAFVTAVASLSVLGYSLTNKRLPAEIVKVVRPAAVYPLAGLAVLSLIAALLVRRRMKVGRPLLRLTPGEKVMPTFVLVSAFLPSIPAVITRVMDIDKRQVVGDSYGREVMENAPPGSVVMVQGDGYLFTLWYQTHVMDRGTHSAIIDVGTLGAQWYKKYLTSHYPTACDPLAPGNLNNREAFEAKCKTFRQRIDLKANQAWITMGERRSRSLTTGERQKGVAILKEALANASGRVPRLPRTDVACDNADYRKAHSKECRCYFEPNKEPTYSDECVFSAEEEGIVPRERVEMWLHRLVEEHIDDRPVFERNLFTHWGGNAGENPRQWVGPDYQRISGDYALLNRGRMNQILYAVEVSAGNADACQKSRSMLDVKRPRGVKSKEGQPYRPNEWPTLITASYLARAPAEGDDFASRQFVAGDDVRMWVDWFEKNKYDPFAKDKKGAAVRHGIRVCVYDGAGARVSEKTMVSTGKRDITFKLPETAAEGQFHVAACTVGEVGDTNKFPEDLPCQRLILEYPFAVTAKSAGK
ncbi:MAG: DUF2723 domain-containing protein [Polyangiaceae bacterium]|nr:DUF2723 domain-containing protein [Polyangiaceae bacterium]